MNQEEFNKLMADNVKIAKEEIAKEEEEKRRKEIEYEKNDAELVYNDVVNDVDTFISYDTFIRMVLPTAIRMTIEGQRKKLADDVNSVTSIEFHITGGAQVLSYRILGDCSLAINVPDRDGFKEYLTGFAEAYDLDYAIPHYGFRFRVGLVDLFRAYTLEKEQGLDNLREKINAELEEYGYSLDNYNEFKKVNGNKPEDESPKSPKEDFYQQIEKLDEDKGIKPRNL